MGFFSLFSCYNFCIKEFFRQSFSTRVTVARERARQVAAALNVYSSTETFNRFKLAKYYYGLTNESLLGITLISAQFGELYSQGAARRIYPAEFTHEEYITHKYARLRRLYDIAMIQDDELDSSGVRETTRERARRAIWSLYNSQEFTSRFQFERAIAFEHKWLIAKDEKKS